MAPAIRIESRRRMGRQSGQATWPWSHAAQMQTSRSQRTQRKRRASRSITGPHAGDVSGHGRGVERWSTSERRLDHRDDPEGSGRSPRAFALSAGPWATRPRQPLQESRRRPPSASAGRPTRRRLSPWRPCKLERERCSPAPRARGFAPTWSPRWTTAPPPSPFATATKWISMSAGSGGCQPPHGCGDRSPAIPSKTGPSKPGGDRAERSGRGDGVFPTRVGVSQSKTHRCARTDRCRRPHARGSEPPCPAGEPSHCTSSPRVGVSRGRRGRRQGRGRVPRARGE